MTSAMTPSYLVSVTTMFPLASVEVRARNPCRAYFATMVCFVVRRANFRSASGTDCRTPHQSETRSNLDPFLTMPTL